ncbi:MAG: efflux RND transporter periplasmic adaptor subunit [Desulfatibacillaceae bacterium]
MDSEEQRAGGDGTVSPMSCEAGPPKQGRGRRAARIAVSIVLMAVFVGAGALLYSRLATSREKVGTHKPPSVAPLVRVMEADPGTITMSVEGQGTVAPLHRIELVPQVGGGVEYVSPSLVPGGAFEKGELLVRVDRRDYELAVTLARANVKDSDSRLKLAEQEAEAARQEWRDLFEAGSADSPEPPPLVAREPQLDAARARLAAHRADLEKALLNLSRTELHAPFAGRVLTEGVDQGQVITAGRSIAELYSTEAAEIEVNLDSSDLAWIRVPGFTDTDGPGSPARVAAGIAGQTRTWDGVVVRAKGVVDQGTRTLPVMVRVDHPYATRPPLAAGLFARVTIFGVSLDSASVVPRAALRDGNTVWIVDPDGRLRFRKVDVARLADGNAVVRSGLAAGDRVVVSRLSAPVEGMSVRAVDTPPEEDPA